MPNKRDPDKVGIGIYINREIRDMVKEALKKRDLTLTEYVYGKLLELLNGEADKVIKKQKVNSKMKGINGKGAKKKN